jgi:intracellular sulfur oxidation DsrE/DsrF family protein
MPDSQNRSVLVQITHDGMGSADQTLSHGLISKWLQLTAQADMLPDVIAFYTDGVKLVCEGSPVLGELRTMQAKGVHLVVCSTCLKHFGLEDKLAVGLKGGMTDMIEAQWRADKVITL